VRPERFGARMSEPQATPMAGRFPIGASGDLRGWSSRLRTGWKAGHREVSIAGFQEGARPEPFGVSMSESQAIQTAGCFPIGASGDLRGWSSRRLAIVRSRLLGCRTARDPNRSRPGRQDSRATRAVGGQASVRPEWFEVRMSEPPNHSDGWTFSHRGLWRSQGLELRAASRLEGWPSSGLDCWVAGRRATRAVGGQDGVRPEWFEVRMSESQATPTAGRFLIGAFGDLRGWSSGLDDIGRAGHPGGSMVGSQTIRISGSRDGGRSGRLVIEIAGGPNVSQSELLKAENAGHRAHPPPITRHPPSSLIWRQHQQNPHRRSDLDAEKIDRSR
jgi:hypothetical protein